MPEIISIFDYLDYRSFLGDIFNLKKETEDLSLRVFARRAGFSSHTFLKNIIEGQRQLTIESSRKVARGFGLNDSETEFLELLVRYEHADIESEKNRVYHLIMEAIPSDTPSKLHSPQFKVFSKWYAMPIREMIADENFNEEYRAIAATLQPPVSPSEAREAVKELMKAGLLKRNIHDRLEQSEPNITTGSEVKSDHVFSYHREILKLADYALRNTPAENRDYSSLLFNITSDQFKYIKQRVQQFRKEIINYLANSENGQPDAEKPAKAVYYLNMQLFNATEVKEKKRESDREVLENENH